MIICSMGMPGSGKTTLSKAIAPLLGVRHLSAGDVSRQLAEHDPEVKAALDAGQITPPAKMEAAMKKYLKEGGYLLDGYPRYWQQLTDAIMHCKHVPLFIYVAMDVHTATARLLERQRYDDNEDAIKPRIDTFMNDTLPVVDFLLARIPMQVCVVDGHLPQSEMQLHVMRWFQNTVGV